MFRKHGWLTLFVMALVCVAIAGAPEAAINAAKAAVPGLEVEEVETCTANGAEAFVVEGEANGAEWCVTVTGAGVVLYTDKEIGEVSVDDVPDVVKNAATAKYPGAEIEEAEKLDRNGETVYELEIEVETAAGEHEYELLIDSKGNINRVSSEDDDDDDDDDDHDDGDDD